MLYKFLHIKNKRNIALILYMSFILTTVASCTYTEIDSSEIENIEQVSNVIGITEEVDQIDNTDENIEQIHDNEINADTKKFLFGEWEVAKFLGFNKILHDDAEWPDGEQIIGRTVIIKEDYFSTLAFEPDYSGFATELQNPIYLYRREDGFHLIVRYLSETADESIRSLTSEDDVLLVSATVYIDGERNSYGVTVINNNRLLIFLNGSHFELEKIS